MKTIKLITVILLPIIFLLSSCSEDESNPTGTYTGGSNNTITGKIYNWTDGTGKTIRAVHGDPGTSNYPWLVSAPISADGSFSITLGTPPDSILNPISQGLPVGINVSDQTAKVGSKIEEFVVSPSGHVWRASSTTYTFFAYSDKNVTVNGSNSGNTYNFNFVKGWNKYTIPISGSGSRSSTEPADSKWIYAP